MNHNNKVGFFKRIFNDISKLHSNIFGLGWLSFFIQLGATMVYATGMVYLQGKMFSEVDFIAMRTLTESTAPLLGVAFGYFSDYLEDRKVILWFGYGSMFFLKLGYLLCALNSRMPSRFIAFAPLLFIILKVIDRGADNARDGVRDALIDQSTKDKSLLATAFSTRKFIASMGSLLSGIISYFMVCANMSQWFVYTIALIPVAASNLFLYFKIKNVGQKPKNVKTFSWKLIITRQLNRLTNLLSSFSDCILLPMLLYRLYNSNIMPIYLKHILALLFVFRNLVEKFSHIPKTALMISMSLLLNMRSMSIKHMSIIAVSYLIFYLVRYFNEDLSSIGIFLLSLFSFTHTMNLVAPPTMLVWYIVAITAIRSLINNLINLDSNSVISASVPIIIYKLSVLFGWQQKYYWLPLLAWAWNYFLLNKYYTTRITKAVISTLSLYPLYRALLSYQNLHPTIRIAILVMYGLLIVLRMDNCQIFYIYPMISFVFYLLRNFSIPVIVLSNNFLLVAFVSLWGIINNFIMKNFISSLNMSGYLSYSLLSYNKFYVLGALIVNFVINKVNNLSSLSYQFISSILITMAAIVCFDCGKYNIALYSRIIVVSLFAIYYLGNQLYKQWNNVSSDPSYHRGNVIGFILIFVIMWLLSKNPYIAIGVSLPIAHSIKYLLESRVGRNLQKQNLNKYYIVLLLAAITGMGMVNKTIFFGLGQLVAISKPATILMFSLTYLSITIYSFVASSLRNYPRIRAAIFYSALVCSHAIPVLYPTKLGVWLSLIPLGISIAGFGSVFSPMVSRSVDDNSIKGTLFGMYALTLVLAKTVIAIWSIDWLKSGAIGNKLTIVGYNMILKRTMFVQIASVILFIIVSFFYGKKLNQNSK